MYNPRVRLNIFVDDISLDFVDVDAGDTIEVLVKACDDIAYDIENKALLHIAEAKSVVLSNSRKVANSVRLELGRLGGPRLTVARSLGIDFWAAAQGQANKVPVRRSRFANLASRRPRLAKLAKVDPGLTAKIYICGILPSVLHDAPIYMGVLAGPSRPSGMKLG